MQQRPVLYVVASGAAPARDLPALISALTHDWDTCVITTPKGARFLDIPRLAQLSRNTTAITPRTSTPTMHPAITWLPLPDLVQAM